VGDMNLQTISNWWLPFKGLGCISRWDSTI